MQLNQGKFLWCLFNGCEKHINGLPSNDQGADSALGQEPSDTKINRELPWVVPQKEQLVCSEKHLKISNETTNAQNVLAVLIKWMD